MKASRELYAGAAQVDITPPMGTQIAGDIGRRRPAELVVDPIYAKSLVLESGGHRLCIISLDLASVTKEWADKIRQCAAQELGTDPEAVMVHAVQDHAAPALGHSAISEDSPHIPTELSWLRGGDDRYNPLAYERILQAVRQARDALEPASVGAASGIEGRVAFNRRFVMRDGTVKTHPKTGDPRIRYAEGPIDPELGVVCFATESLHIPAMLLYYTCHPVHGYPEHWISAGWPGAWSDGVRGAYGQGCVPLVLNGCCGNIHHANHLDPSYIDDFQRMGRLLTETTHGVLKRINYQRDVVLGYEVKHIAIPIRDLPVEQIESARALLAEHPEPMWLDDKHTSVHWDWVYAVAKLDLHELRQRTPVYDYEIQLFRIGDTAIVALPGEPFVEGQLRIKLESPTYPTYVLHNCNAAQGYIPTAQALRRGGYETWTSNWSMLAPEALDTVVDGAIEVLRGAS